MTQRFGKSWWLLALCGVLDAIIAAIYLFQQDTFTGWHGTIALLGRLTLAAGVCTMVAGIWSSRNRKAWLLVLNGIACGTLGAILVFWRGPLAFRTVALLIVVMAISIGTYELITARSLRSFADEWLIGATGVASVGFAVAFLAFVFRWMKLEPRSPAQSLNWLGSYFAFSALCMLVLTMHLHRRLPSAGDTPLL